MGRPVQGGSPSNGAPVPRAGSGRRLADVLAGIYDEIFLAQVPLNAFSAAFKSYMTESAPYLCYGAEEMKEQTPCTPLVYYALFPLLVKEVLETCKHHYSSLGHAQPRRGPSYLAVALARDKSTHFLSEQVADMHIDMDDAKFLGLAQTWTAVHPLSPYIGVSQALEAGSLNRALRSVIASEALVMTKTAGAGSELFLGQAHKCFGEARLPHAGDKGVLMLACQVSMLLAWNHIAATRAKNGVAFLALACQLMAQLQGDTAVEVDTLAQDRLAGLSSLLTVWAFSQLDRSSGFQVHNRAGPLLSSVAQMCSLLLSNHPGIRHGDGHAVDGDVDLGVLCGQLRGALAAFPLEDDDMARAARHLLTLYLLAPRRSTPALHEELLSSCVAALPLLARLANEAQEEDGNAHLLSKLAFHRRTSQRSGEKEVEAALRSTLAATLFETLVEAVQMMARSLSDGSTRPLAPRLVLLSYQLMTTPMASVADSSQLKQARADLATCVTELEGADEDQSMQWFDEAQPAAAQEAVPDWSGATSSAEDDIYEQLWGQLQWNTPSDYAPPSS